MQLEEMLSVAERNLNDALRHFEQHPGGDAQAFVELKLQSCIFQYDVCSEMVSVVRNQASGFASSVALKGLVLRLFEYDVALNDHWIPRLLALAQRRGLPAESQAIRDARSSWKAEFKQLRGWSVIRNKAAGHYDAEVGEQVRLLKNLTVDGVMGVARAFLTFNMALLVLMREAGLGPMVSIGESDA